MREGGQGQGRQGPGGQLDAYFFSALTIRAKAASQQGQGRHAQPFDVCDLRALLQLHIALPRANAPPRQRTPAPEEGGGLTKLGGIIEGREGGGG